MLKKYFLIFVGTLSLTLGIIGVALPVLPTTPFLLLASFCYIRSSKRLYNWLMNHKIFGPYLYNYMTHHAIKKSVKIVALVSLWVSLIISIIFISNSHLAIFLVFVGMCVSIHLLKLKTFEETKAKK